MEPTFNPFSVLESLESRELEDEQEAETLSTTQLITRNPHPTSKPNTPTATTLPLNPTFTLPRNDGKTQNPTPTLNHIQITLPSQHSLQNTNQHHESQPDKFPTLLNRKHILNHIDSLTPKTSKNGVRPTNDPLPSGATSETRNQPPQDLLPSTMPIPPPRTITTRSQAADSQPEKCSAGGGRIANVYGGGGLRSCSPPSTLRRRSPTAGDGNIFGMVAQERGRSRTRGNRSPSQSGTMDRPLPTPPEVETIRSTEKRPDQSNGCMQHQFTDGHDNLTYAEANDPPSQLGRGKRQKKPKGYKNSGDSAKGKVDLSTNSRRDRSKVGSSNCNGQGNETPTPTAI